MGDLQLKNQLPIIARSIKSGGKLFEKYRSKRGYAVNADEQLQELLNSGPRTVQSPYNKLVNRLGEPFASGDDACVAAFEQITADIERLVDQLALRLDNALSGQDVVFDPEVEQQWESEFRDNLEEGVKRIKMALTEFLQRNWNITPSSLLGSPVRHDSLRRVRGSPYCPGALRLQRDPQATLADMAIAVRGGESYRCTECALDFKDLELPHRDHTEEDWVVVARNHLRASISLKDRRAWLQCLECRRFGREHYTVSTRSLLHHLREHATLEATQEKLDAARSTVVL